jgi:hypothetical protein
MLGEGHALFGEDALEHREVLGACKRDRSTAGDERVTEVLRDTLRE